MDPLWLKAILKALILPPGGPLVLAGVGFALLGRHARCGRALIASAFGVLLCLSLPPVAYLLLRAVDASPPFDPQEARGAQAIVILGGGIRRDAPEYGGDTLSTLTLERTRYGARVARLTGLPVLVSGGTVFHGEPEAKLMRDALEGEFGVPVRWAEPRSRNTHENAVRSADILRREGIARVVLVAHGFDMPRARAEFAAQGIDIVAAPTGIATGSFDRVLDWLPSMGALQGSYYALYELLGLAVFRVTAAFR
jgi:uncharacterized SAM-binding protein YcdF (DUF218 family)